MSVCVCVCVRATFTNKRSRDRAVQPSSGGFMICFVNCERENNKDNEERCDRVLDAYEFVHVPTGINFVGEPLTDGA